MKTTLFITLLLLELISHGQLAKFENDSLIFINRDGNDADLSQLMTYELSKIANINTNSSLGNFIGFSTTDNNLSVNYNFKGRNFGLFEVYAKGGISEGITKLFTDDKLNNGITLGTKYHFLVGKRMADYKNIDFVKLESEYLDLKYKYELKKLKYEAEIVSINEQIQRKEKDLDNVASRNRFAQIAVINARLENQSPKKIDSLIYIQDTLNTIESIYTLEIKELRRKRKDLISGDTQNLEKNSFIINRNNILSSINSISPIGRRIQWFSVGFSITQESFQLFDKTLALDKQIYKVQDLVPTMDFAFTRFRHFNLAPKKHTRFFSVGATIKYGNNVGRLDNLDIQTRDSININRVIFKTQTAYSGNYLDNQITAKITLDYYNFVGNKDNIGFHLRATHDLGPFAPVSSFRIGIMLSAMKDNSSSSNIEVFFGLNDLFKNHGENSLFGRNVFGIQTSFPFK